MARVQSLELTKDEWIFVLKLATMWQFHTLRRIALDKIKPHLSNSAGIPVRWLYLARQYDVDEWVLPSLLTLTKRPRPLQFDEAKQASLRCKTQVRAH